MTVRQSHCYGDQPLSSSAAALIYLEVDVHEDSISIAVLPEQVPREYWMTGRFVRTGYA